MSAQYQQFASSSSKPKVDADGTIRYVDSNGDMVQASNGNDIFYGLRHAGGEAFVESDSEEETHHHAQPQYVAQPHYGAPVPQYAYAPTAASSSSSKKSKKEKKEKKHKKERSPEYISVPSAASPHACSCGNHRH